MEPIYNSRFLESPTSIKKDIVSSVPEEVAIQIIFSQCDTSDLKSLILVNKTWNRLALNDYTKKSLLRKKQDEIMMQITLGPKEWERIGYITEVPKLPDQLWEILISPCPFFPHKMIFQTHDLLLMPKRIAANTYNMRLLERYTGLYKPMSKLEFTNLSTYNDRNEKLTRIGSYWMLVPKTILSKECVDNAFLSTHVKDNYARLSSFEIASYMFISSTPTKKMPFLNTDRDQTETIFCGRESLQMSSHINKSFYPLFSNQMNYSVVIWESGPLDRTKHQNSNVLGWVLNENSRPIPKLLSTALSTNELINETESLEQESDSVPTRKRKADKNPDEPTENKRQHTVPVPETTAEAQNSSNQTPIRSRQQEPEEEEA